MITKAIFSFWGALAVLGVLIYITFPGHRFINIAEAENGIELSVLASDPATKDAQAVVVELFTSQACFSCPPAEAYLRELSGRRDVITLEYHVDYWNDQVYGMDGKWHDPFSSPDATERQRIYNMIIRNKKRVYTPQVVVDGWRETIGSRKDEVDEAIGSAERGRLNGIAIAPAIDAEGMVTLALPASDKVKDNVDVVLVRFFKRHVTQVSAGENRGKTLASYNIVRQWVKLGDWKGQADALEAKVTPLDDNEGCAVLLQDSATMRIHAAAFCAPAG